MSIYTEDELLNALAEGGPFGPDARFVVVTTGEIAEFRKGLVEAGRLALGDSNDAEIEHLQSLVDDARNMLDLKEPQICSECEEAEVDEHGMCSSCLHNAYRSGWEPGT